MNQPKIIVALDYSDINLATRFVNQLSPSQCSLKIGKELFTSAGPDFVRRVVDLGFNVFLDLKFHDIPSTVSKACSAAAKLGVWMLNVHASGGSVMMQAAREAIEASTKSPLLIAVTVLTSMDSVQLQSIGIDSTPQQQVNNLAILAQGAGLDGIVCSAQEIKQLKPLLEENFIYVTPGIRLIQTPNEDQLRIVTPEKAMIYGSDYLVIGRPITQSKDPLAVISKIIASIQGEHLGQRLK